MHTLIISTQRLTLTPPAEADSEAMLDYHRGNRLHLQPWEPRRDETFYTDAAMAARVAAMVEAMRAGSALHLLVRTAAGGPVIGEIGFTNIVRGAFQACHLGFSVCGQAQGQGLMHEALTGALAAVFDQVGLHRVMANYRPENARSARLLDRLGFEREGLARAYLHIDGAWRDHVLTSLISHP